MISILFVKIYSLFLSQNGPRYGGHNHWQQLGTKFPTQLFTPNFVNGTTTAMIGGYGYASVASVDVDAHAITLFQDSTQDVSFNYVGFSNLSRGHMGNGFNRLFYSTHDLKIPPYPTISAAPVSVYFQKEVAMGGMASMSVTLKNTGSVPLIIDSAYTGTRSFEVEVPSDTVLDSIKLTVRFTPDVWGTTSDTVFVVNNSPIGTFEIPLLGSCPLPMITFSAAVDSLFSADPGQVDSRVERITNRSVSELILDSAKTSSKYFAVSGVAFPDSVRQTDTSYMTITFAPDSVGEYGDTLFIYANYRALPFEIPLSGIGGHPTGVSEGNSTIPSVYALAQNYPNPFNPATTVKFALPKQSQVSLVIYDILGREVKELVNDKLQAGYYHFTWDATRFASGVYFCRIEAQSLSGDRKSFVEVKKLLLLK